MAVLVCLGCSAQSAGPDLNKRIERQVRDYFNVPRQVQITIGERKPSEFANHDSVTIAFNNGGRTTTHDFLLSKDGKTLVRLSKIDVSPDAYNATLKKDIEARRQTAELMKRVDLTGRPLRGNKDAAVTVLVYDDYQCPYCASMYDTLFKDVMTTYGQQVRVVFKDYPLFEIHPWAKRAAINAICLAEQSGDAYWRFSDYVHASQREISGPARDLVAQNSRLDKAATDAAGKFRLDAARLQACLKAQPDAALKASVREAESLGVSATPTLFVNGQKFEGAVDAAELRQAIDLALTDAGQKPPSPAAAATQPATSSPPAGSNK